MSKLIPYLRKTFYILALGMLIGLLVYFKKQHRTQVCSAIDIRIVVPLDKQLVTEDMLREYLLKWYSGGLVGVELADIDISDIEKKIEALEPIRNVEVSVQLNGELRIEVDQRIPIVRIMSQPSYYLDRNKRKIYTTGLEPARVPVASGALHGEMIDKIYTLSTYVQENAFAEALCEQIFVTNDGDLILIPKIGSQQVIIGQPTELDSKFRRLEQFYKYGLNKLGWDKYKTINLSFADQIVCN